MPLSSTNLDKPNATLPNDPMSSLFLAYVEPHNALMNDLMSLISSDVLAEFDEGLLNKLVPQFFPLMRWCSPMKWPLTKRHCLILMKLVSSMMHVWTIWWIWSNTTRNSLKKCHCSLLSRIQQGLRKHRLKKCSRFLLLMSRQAWRRKSLRESIADEALSSELSSQPSSSTSDGKCSNLLVCRTRRRETNGDINRNRGIVLLNSWTCA